MENKQFKFVKGVCKPGQPADIYFYTDVDYWSVDDFIWEFNYLLNNVGVSKINIHINSVGGSVVDGMSVFSRIMDCQIPTACYNDGLAASMGSIIWAAGKEVYMKDYALLMIHNPFIDSGDGKTYNQVTEAFTAQLKTIYQKRFGLTEDEVNAIMNGEGENDGTFFTSAQAVERGFLTADHVIETPEAERGQVNAILKDGIDVTKLKAVMNSLTGFSAMPATTYQEKPQTSPMTQDNISNSLNNKTMKENEITVFAALFGLTGEKATVENVSAQITELKAKADKFDETQAALDNANKELGTAKTELEGAKASVKNLTADLEKANASLKEYQDAEAKAQAEKIDALVEAAIKDCKIDEADKETWVKMAQNDFTLAESVLAKIPARENISGAIATEGAQAAQEGVKTEEQKMQAKVDEIVGKDFKYATLD